MPAPEPPVVHVTNVRPPPAPTPAAEDERLFAEEGPAEGCASGECLPEAEPEPEAPPPPSAPASTGRDNPRRPLQDRWRAAMETVRERVSDQNARHAKALAFGRLVALREGEVMVAYLPTHGLHKKAILGSGRPILEQALSEHFGRPTRLVAQDTTEGDGAAGLISLAEQEVQERTEYERSTEGRVRNHPAVHATLRLLGGEIEHIQVYDLPVRPAAAPASEAPEESP